MREPFTPEQEARVRQIVAEAVANALATMNYEILGERLTYARRRL